MSLHGLANTHSVLFVSVGVMMISRQWECGLWQRDGKRLTASCSFSGADPVQILEQVNYDTGKKLQQSAVIQNSDKKNLFLVLVLCIVAYQNNTELPLQHAKYIGNLIEISRVSRAKCYLYDAQRQCLCRTVGLYVLFQLEGWKEGFRCLKKANAQKTGASYLVIFQIGARCAISLAFFTSSS